MAPVYLSGGINQKYLGGALEDGTINELRYRFKESLDVPNDSPPLEHPGGLQLD